MSMNNVIIITPEDGWVEIHEGLTDILIQRGSSPVSIADSDEAPGENYADDVWVLGSDKMGVIQKISFENKVWAKVYDGEARVFAQDMVEIPVPTVTVANSRYGKSLTLEAGVAYEPGTAIGGLINLGGAGAAQIAMLMSAILRVAGEQTAKFKLYLLREQPKDDIADRADVTVLAAEPLLLLGVIPLEDPDTDTGISLYVHRNINQVLTGVDRLFGVLVADTAITFNTATDLTVEVGLQVQI